MKISNINSFDELYKYLKDSDADKLKNIVDSYGLEITIKGCDAVIEE